VIAIIGLGNPGYEYDGTRHNVGFLVVDLLCKKLRTNLQAGRGDYLLGSTVYEERDLLLVKPLTYMNNSGVAVADVKNHYGLRLEDLLVVCDDFNLPLGTIRLRRCGSDGGHNGLYSIIYQLQSEDFPRLRCGIGGSAVEKKGFDATGFVLSPFEREEKAIVQRMLHHASDAALSVVSDGLSIAMNRWNAASTANLN
jgi:PTH1 family peptidyl-tRNA hydrolase